MNTDVLISGAGPTGLTLALWLTRLGVKPRIIDRNLGPGETSRALAVQSRTLEFQRQIGVVDDVLAAGVRVDQLTVHTPSGIAANLKLSDFGRGISPYSFAFALPQDVHERILIGHLKKLGIDVEWETELTHFDQDEGGVTASLTCRDNKEVVRASYLAGADGAHSVVRHALQIGFPGGTYEQSFYVADVEGHGNVTRNGMDTVVSAYGFAIIMPVRQSGSLRLIGIVPQAHESDETITFEAIRADVERDTGVTVDKVNWFSTYRVHHRVADRFRAGRAFLVGDAGHIHSPAGGQGMNTGMGDAVNLAWKLASVLQGRADVRLLDSYEPERLAFAKLLIESTDKVFRVATSKSRLVGMFRQYVMPKLLSLVLSTEMGSRKFFGIISQTRINYRASPISPPSTDKLRPGDRLPFVTGSFGDNFEPLKSLDWQFHVYGAVRPNVASALQSTGLVLHEFPWADSVDAAGLKQDTVYLIRPDGHIAVIADAQDPSPVMDYLKTWKIKSRSMVEGHASVENQSELLS